jgi:hypothetical protein
VKAVSRGTFPRTCPVGQPSGTDGTPGASGTIGQMGRAITQPNANEMAAADDAFNGGQPSSGAGAAG